MTDVIVLGAGLVGSVIAADLTRDSEFNVTIADRSCAALDAAKQRASGKITCLEHDLGDTRAINKLVAPFDLVIGALPGSLGYQTLDAVINAGKPFCDISFMPEDAAQLDHAAQQAGATAIVDIGVAPGMSNILAARAARELDRCDSISIYVGGLPKHPQPPFYYKAGFSPIDVIEEYTRPARFIKDKQIVTRDALSDCELIELPRVGQLEAFNTDGLRSLMHTLDVPNMIEKTLRYRGHAELMRMFRETDLFSYEPIDVAGQSIRPIDVTAQLLFPKWRYEPGEADITVMRIIATGLLNDEPCSMTWDLYDEYDGASETLSMARTTAFPCAIIARLLARGAINTTGVIAPEQIAENDALVTHALDELKRRGVQYEQSVQSDSVG